MREFGLRMLMLFPLALAPLEVAAQTTAPPPAPKPEAPLHPAPDAAWAAVTRPAPGPTRVVGGYTHGCIQGAKALPLDGPGYTVLRPQRLRYFGHPILIDLVRDLGARAEADGWGTLLVGDLSQPRGGPMSYGHASHEAGLDVDIWLRLLPPGQRLDDAERRDPTEVSVVRPDADTADPHLWRPEHAALIHAAAMDPRVERLFVNPAIKATLCETFPPDGGGTTAWLRKVRPWYGHDSHVHIRLTCPTDSPACEPQAPVPPEAGCDDATFIWWGEELARRIAAKAKQAAETAGRAVGGGQFAPPSVARVPQPLPAACQAVLIAR